MSAIREGDLVRLKIGGPDMAVLAIVKDHEFIDGIGPGVFCLSEVNHVLFEQIYPPHMIDLVVRQGGFDVAGFVRRGTLND